MALPLVVPAGITAARVAAPYVASLVRQYGPKVLGALTGASVGDKFIDIGQLEKDKDIGKLPPSVKTETEEDFKIPPFMGVIPSVVDLIEGFSQADSKPKEKGFVQEDLPDMSKLDVKIQESDLSKKLREEGRVLDVVDTLRPGVSKSTLDNPFFGSYYSEPSTKSVKEIAMTDPLGEKNKDEKIKNYQSFVNRVPADEIVNLTPKQLDFYLEEHYKKIDEDPSYAKYIQELFETGSIKKANESILKEDDVEAEPKSKPKTKNEKIFTRANPATEQLFNYNPNQLSRSEFERLAKNPKIRAIFKKNLIKGHALEQSAVNVLPDLKEKLGDEYLDFKIYELIPKKILEDAKLKGTTDLTRPIFFTTTRGNRLHEYLGQQLIGDLIEKYKVQGYTFEPFKNERGGEWVYNKDIIPEDKIKKIKQLNESIEETNDKLKALKLQTIFYNPAKDRLVYFGEGPTSLADLKKTMEKRGFSKGGIVSMEEIIHEPISLKYTS
tara:strand:- start:19 stop:1503 length:1485 start_codon:yes stop_codon:yes gene_type:complete